MKFLKSIAVALLVLATGLIFVPSASAYRGGSVDDPATRNPVTEANVGRQYFLNNNWDTNADQVLLRGYHLDRVIVGDWDGNGTDTIATRRGLVYTFYNGVTANYGRRNDEVLVGDWDGDGIDTLAVRRGRTYHMKNSVSGGDADVVVEFGREDDHILVGDWDGDGIDTLAVRRGREYHINNTLRSGVTSFAFEYGREGDMVLVGDWDGNGTDTLSIRRDRAFHVNNSLSGGSADFAQEYGREDDDVLVGDWDGNGTDTVGVRRREIPHPTPANNAERFARDQFDLRLDDREDIGAPISAIGWMGQGSDYMWIKGSYGAGHGWNSDQMRWIVAHEGAHSYQIRACGKSSYIPRFENVADALARRIAGYNRPVGNGYGYTEADMDVARQIMRGECPVN